MSEWAHDAMEGKFKEVFFSGHGLSGLATSRCNEVVADLTGRIQSWCHARTLVPHVALDIVASLALAMAASGTAAGPGFGHELLERARNMDGADGTMGLVEAAGQVAAYLGETSSPSVP